MERTITLRFWTLSGWRDHTGPWVASRGWMEVSECGFYLEKRVEWLFGDQKDWLWYQLLFANSFPFLPRHPSASFPSFPCRQAEPHDFLLANGMRPKWYNPLPSSVHKDQLSSLRWIFSVCQPCASAIGDLGDHVLYVVESITPSFWITVWS